MYHTMTNIEYVTALYEKFTKLNDKFKKIEFKTRHGYEISQEDFI